MRRSFVTVLLGAALVAGCSSSDGPTTTCGENTQPVNGVCETLVTCGEGTVLVNNICQPQAGAGACAAGTQEVDGRCVPAAEACDPGTRFVDGSCVPDFTTVCGEGTEESGGECILVLELECGPGTVQTTVSSDDGKQEVAVCELLCTGDQIWDETAEDCVDACTEGSEFDDTTNTCVALCADDQYYSSTLDNCVDVPLCLRNAEDVDGNCVGWPFDELTLETVCARRAFNMCAPIFDPACSCDHAGDYLGGTDANNFTDGFPADMAGCIMEELLVCDILILSVARALEDEGQLEADVEALQDFDDYFALPEGTCTRPSDFEPLPLDLFFGLTNGLVEEEGECLNDASCADTHECRVVRELAEAGIEPYFVGACLPRAAEGEFCTNSGLVIDLGIGPGGDPSTSVTCQADLICLFDNTDQRNECTTPRILGAPCGSDSECQDGLFCFPADLDNITGPAYVFANPRTCQSPQSEGVGCLADGRSINGVSVSHDVCAANLRCDDAARSADGDGVGQCVAAVGVGQPCAYCDEYQFSGIFGPEIAPFTQDPFSVCGGELGCTFEALTEGFAETCESEISVCPPTLREVLNLGGVCNPFEFVCNDGLDEDGDEAIDCDDSDCATRAENCNCGDELDNDGDDLVDCDDPDCEGAEGC